MPSKRQKSSNSAAGSSLSSGAPTIGAGKTAPVNNGPVKNGPGKKAAPATQRTIRETVESIAIAFVLAFLFRTFEAEAFVIPTGSMAPTLQGRHKDVVCPECHFRYRVSASSEVDDVTGQEVAGREVMGGTCPNCRYTLDFSGDSRWPSYNGDRILVAKFPYDFAEPDRWDIVVFRYPGNAKMNYIKRLVGRPYETVRIRHGDIYIQPGDEDEAHSAGSSSPADFDIARKPPDKVRAMAQTVYNNDYVVDAMTQAGWPLRWQNWSSEARDKPAAGTSSPGPWQSPDGGRTFHIESGQGEAWLRYQHFIPFAEDWRDIKAGRAAGFPRPRLITDFYAYNTDEHYQVHRDPPLGQNWVGDLLLEAMVATQSAEGTLLLDLVRAGRHARCTIDLSTGAAELSVDDAPDLHPRAQTALNGAGRHRVAFANVDRRLILWIDGSVVPFDADTAYPAVGDDIPNQDDLVPAGIGARDAALDVEHIVLKRDVYYIAADSVCPDRSISDYDSCDIQRDDLADFFASPELWTPDSFFAHRQEVTFPLKADQFFVLGDNSPASKDSRLWEGKPEYYVSRQLLIGKALFIYWPHSFHRLPFVDFPFPYFPNFQDMGFVR